MNWIDTPLLVYAFLAEHPARDVVAGELRSGAWASTALALPECYHVLTRDYAVEPERAARVVSELERTGIAWSVADSSQIASAINECCRHGLQSTDAV